jgi:hypothetical protein
MGGPHAGGRPFGARAGSHSKHLARIRLCCEAALKSFRDREAERLFDRGTVALTEVRSWRAPSLLANGQITRASSAKASASRAPGGTSVPSS